MASTAGAAQARAGEPPRGDGTPDAGTWAALSPEVAPETDAPAAQDPPEPVVAALVDRHVAQGRGKAVAIHTPDATCTYQQLQALVNRAGNVLRGVGVEPEQRVALLLPDGLDFAAAFLGALKIGAVAVPLNTRLRPEEVAGILCDSRAKALVVDASLLPGVQDRLADLRHLKAVLLAEDGGEESREGGGRAGEALAADWAAGVAPRRLRLRDALAAAEPTLAHEPMSPDDMAFWLYTSGTTGAPKATVHVRRTLLAGGPYSQAVLRLTPDDRVFGSSKLFFAYALGNALLIPLLAGARTYLHPAWADPEMAAGVLRDFAPTVLFSVPTFYARLLRSDLPPALFRSLRLCVSAGERLPAELFAAWQARFGVPIVDGLGVTETIFIFLSNRPDRPRPGCSGYEVPGTRARILDAEGQPVPDGAEGVLWVTTPSTAAGYWNRLEQTRQAFVGAWYRTRDVYVRHPDGCFEHRGREDDVFKVAGQWVTPVELERAFLEHPAVLEVGVVGAEDELGLTKPFAFVLPRQPPADAAALARELEAFVGARLRPHQRPKRVVVVSDLPRTATGKLQRFKLRQHVRALLSGP